MKIRILLGGIIGLAAIDARAAEIICPKYSYCKEGIQESCGNKFCNKEGTTYQEWLALPVPCLAGRNCVAGRPAGNCEAGMHLKDPAQEDSECELCPPGNKCPNGNITSCNENIFSYQDESGRSECKSCEAGKVANSTRTGCVNANWAGPFDLPANGKDLDPGVYKFELSGGGGGSGSTTCNNCGNFGSSQGGGYGEKKTTPPITFLSKTTVKPTIGARGRGGGIGQTSRVNDAEGHIAVDGSAQSCTYSCTEAKECANGEAGGETRLEIQGTYCYPGAVANPCVAAGGKGGKGKTLLIKENGGASFAEFKAPAESGGQCQTTNGGPSGDNPNCGAAGGPGVKQDHANNAGHAYWSDGYAGNNGYVKYWYLTN